jgi:hypothetical protein
MNKALVIFSHLTVILSLMFAVFLILDQFNPMMNFIDNDASRWLLFALCLSSILRSILCWRHSGREEAGKERS